VHGKRIQGRKYSANCALRTIRSSNGIKNYTLTRFSTLSVSLVSAEQRNYKWRRRYEAAMHTAANEVRARATLMQEIALIQEINKREKMSVHPFSASLIVLWTPVDRTYTTSQSYDLTGRHLLRSPSACQPSQYSTSSRDSRGAACP
jgi:thiamine biosynthesis lipoprotein ApbE